MSNFWGAVQRFDTTSFLFDIFIKKNAVTL